MIVTREWLFEHQTKNGSWTSAQVRALGMAWPPKHGWVRELIGKEITQEQAAAFVAGASMFVRGKHRPDPTHPQLF